MVRIFFIIFIKSIDLFSFFNYYKDDILLKFFFIICFIIFSYLRTMFFSSAPNCSCNLLL